MNLPAHTAANPGATPRALIAEDEHLLAQALRLELGRAWPELQLLESAVDGDDAVERALEHLPELLFLDIRMPGRSGLEAAQAIVEDWPAQRALPLIVFVTAYDQYALQAFEASAVDYVLKPVQPARLAAACERLRGLMRQRQATPAGSVNGPLGADDALLQRLRGLLGGGVSMPDSSAPAQPPLVVLQASAGNAIHMVPVREVVYFEAADKYVRVLTAGREHLIRLSLRELLPRLDGEQFWQVHRSLVVNATEIDHALRDDTGKISLVLRQRPERLPVSRLYAPRFKGM